MCVMGRNGKRKIIREDGVILEEKKVGINVEGIVRIVQGELKEIMGCVPLEVEGNIRGIMEMKGTKGTKEMKGTKGTKETKEVIVRTSLHVVLM